MFESKHNQPKLDSSQDKYLIINPASLLDAIVTSRALMKDDLILRQLEEGVFSILKDGKQIAKYLDKLITEYGYTLILYSNRKEHQIIHALEDLNEAYKGEGLKRFPKIAAVVVKDREACQNVRASDPRVTESRSHGILVAGYSLHSHKEAEILVGCSNLLHFSKSDQNSYTVLDNRSFFCENAKGEGWNIYHTSSTSINKILYDICQKSAATNNQNSQGNLEEHIEEENKAGIETITFRSEAESTSSPSKALDSTPQHSNYSKHEAEQKNLVEKSNYDIVKPTTNSLGPSLYSLKTSDGNSQKLSQLNTTMEVDKIEKEEAGSNENKESKDWQPPSLLPSDLKFKIINGPQIRGSSAILRWFVDEPTNSRWVGKCSYLELHKKDHFYEYKEFLGILIYRLFGVRTPNTVFSEQLLDEEFQRNNFIWASDVKNPRLYLMSNFVSGFELLGDQFIEDYKASSKRNKKQLFYVKGENRPLRGFGRAVAVAILIHDYSLVGNSGGDIGYIPSENDEYLEILKIDPGESLSFAENMSMAPFLDNPPINRGALAGTLGHRINFDDLNDFDKRECVETLKEMLEIKVATLEKLFTPFLKVDIKFRIIFEELLNRRQKLLAAFYGEVGSLIELYIQELEEQQAVEQMSNWDKSPLSLPLQRAKKGQLIRDKVQLEAFTAAADKNTSDTEILRRAPYSKVTFVGRDRELSQIKKVFSGNTEIIGCAVVGGAGLGEISTSN